ncbi:MAG: FkbM family methyltransferase [Rudaea sp.]
MPSALRRLRYYARSIATLASRIERPHAVAWTLLARGGGCVVRFRDGPALACRDAMDLWVAKETCLDRDYERYGTAIASGWTIVDIGAGIGDFTILAARAAHAGRVVACEPATGAVKLLRENLQRNGVTNVDVIDAAIAATASPRALSVHRHGATASTLGVAPDERSLTVAAMTLADVLARIPSGRCDLLKSDCEGAEFDFLLAADDATLARIRRIVLEYHDWHGNHHAALEERLREAGFSTVSTHPNAVHADTGFLYAERPASRNEPPAHRE